MCGCDGVVAARRRCVAGCCAILSSGTGALGRLHRRLAQTHGRRHANGKYASASVQLNGNLVGGVWLSRRRCTWVVYERAVGVLVLGITSLQRTLMCVLCLFFANQPGHSETALECKSFIQIQVCVFVWVCIHVFVTMRCEYVKSPFTR